MKFCVNCNNMYYLNLDVDNDTDDNDVSTMTYYCKKCNHKEPVDNFEAMKEVTYEKYPDTPINVNENIKYDPTIPHVHHLLCPNKDCTKDKSHPNDVIYYIYDENNMKYVYMCCYCNQMWQ